MATHSSVLAWRIPGTGSLVGCCLWGRTESDTAKVMQQQHGRSTSRTTVVLLILESVNTLGNALSCFQRVGICILLCWSLIAII